MIRGIDHINIVVGDMERSVRFYTELLGFKLTRRAHLEGPWIEKAAGLCGVVADAVFLEAPGGGPHVELLQYHVPAGRAVPGNAVPNTPGLRHFALRCDDAEALAAKLKAAGVKLLSPGVVEVPGDVVSPPVPGRKLLYFLDPDGVILELAQYG